MKLNDHLFLMSLSARAAGGEVRRGVWPLRYGPNEHEAFA